MTQNVNHKIHKNYFDKIKRNITMDISNVLKLSDLIVCFVVLLIELSYRQDERMDEINLFIEHYSKYIVSTI